MTFDIAISLTIPGMLFRYMTPSAELSSRRTRRPLVIRAVVP